MKKMLARVGVLISVVYLLNPGGGIFELIPDNIPIIGNLDEAGMTTFLIWCISILREKPEDALIQERKK
jgi:uncharacterized membrane protein YkvA (DUF1232 family)